MEIQERSHALRKRSAGWLVLACLGVPGQPATAQSLEVGDPIESYLRALQISGLAELGSFTVRPLVETTASAASGGHPWADRYTWSGPVPSADSAIRWSGADARLRAFANTSHPYGANDGVIWQGRGVTTAVDARASAAWKRVSITLNPTLVHNQNHHFELADVRDPSMPRYAYPWRKVDLPQRFGPDGFWTFDLGQSEITVDWKGGRFGVGTGNLWWGPGVQNAIVMSNNAGGFPHASLSTRQPLDIGIGTLEGQWIWGRLAQSDWFDPSEALTERFITGLVVSYTPSFLDGLTVGGTRVFQEHVQEGGVDFGDYFLVLQGLAKSGQSTSGNPTGNDERDQLVSLFARWALVESGFEAYVEWARNDHAWNLRDFVLEPEHSQGYTLGFQKVAAVSSARAILLRGELTHLEAPPTFQLRGRGTYYAHGIVTQGYTHGGQVIGAGVGPGGNAQYVGVDYYAPWGRGSFSATRRVTDNDAFWVWAAENGASFDRHDVSLDFGGNVLLLRGNHELGGGMTLTRQFNRYFYGRDGWNLNLSLSARWRQG